MFYLIINEIIPYNDLIEKSLLKLLKESIIEKASQEEYHESSSEPVLEFAKTLVNLIYKDKFKDVKKLKKIVKDLQSITFKYEMHKKRLIHYINLLKLYIEPETCDFEEIKLLDFLHFSDEFIKKITSNDVLKEPIAKLFFEKFNMLKILKKDEEKLRKIFNMLLK